MKLHQAVVPFFCAFILAGPFNGWSADQTNQISEAEALKKIEAKLHYQTGSVQLPNGIGTLNLPADFRYLPPKDSEFVLSDLWGNPPGQKTLGMIFPPDGSPVKRDSWAVVITYSDDGYVKDSDADKIDYTKLLTDMQKGAKEANKARVAEGYGAVELVGWATPPHYDKTTHKMYWAKELRFSDSKTNTLNYNIRVLGRRGVLNLNAVASMTQLALVEKHAPEIVSMVDFTAGNRYADFNQKTDRVAAYGLAALVAGGIAAKAGLFKVLIGALVAAKKLVIVGVIAVIAFVKRMVGGGKAA